MVVNFLAFAIPFFLFFIGLEYLISKKNGKNYFKFSSSVANLNIGIVERLTDLFVAGSFYFFYDYLHQNFALFNIKAIWWQWLLLLLATDFLWYWYHRFGHEINLFWGFHVVHHTSEEFNYTAATRITFFQSFVRTLFWAILPIIGFPAEMITTILLIHGTYPFFTHTQTIGKLGWLEYIIVTPSHHRVHHANNEAYLDKNFGDIFIFWDKIFGTYAEEKEEATFGLTKQLQSYSLLWQHFHFLVELFYAVIGERGLVNKLKMLFGSPTKFDPALRSRLEKTFLSKHKVSAKSSRFKNYIVGQMVLSLAFLFCLLLFGEYLSISLKILTTTFLFVTAVNCGAILEQKRWVFYLEIIRLLIVFVSFYEYFPIQTINLAIGLAIYYLLFDLDLYKKANQQYLKYIYGN
ncbi:MAG: sterol desaturase family protein [Bacteroidota bacterium]